MPSYLATRTLALLSPRRNERRGVVPQQSNGVSADASSAVVQPYDDSKATKSVNATATTTVTATKQPPAATMAVAYSLFLLGRCAPPSDAAAAPTPRRLPVRLDLRADGCVRMRPCCDDNPHHDFAHCPEERAGADDDTGAEVEAEATDAQMTREFAQQRQVLQTHLSHASDLRSSRRHIAIVTTAAMPWMTGTSVNPALRAIYLAKDGHDVTLVVPWLSTPEEQRKLFSAGSPVFTTKAEQARHIVHWARTHVRDVAIRIRFYEGVYSDDFGSIMPVGAITDVFAERALVKDVCILEEPEHLTWHHAGQVWTELFNFVVGVIHTNYIEYARKYGFFGPQKALALLFLNTWVCRGYCHRIIKLSDAVQQFPNSVTSNVHGVRDRFLHIGRLRGAARFPRGAYFMGKVLWAKGYRDLIDGLLAHFERTGRTLPIDFFGDGPDAAQVGDAVRDCEALRNVRFTPQVVDHAGEHLRGYKVFVNASRSDVVCTATAEALAMGKFVVCLRHASNEFFATFDNCFTYGNVVEFSTAVERALASEPCPLSEQDAYRLTWEAATERLYDAVRLPLSKRRASTVDLALGSAHATLSKIYPQPGKNIRRAIQQEDKLKS